jgi:hypothetical protein
VTVDTANHRLVANRSGKYIVDYHICTEKTDVKDYEFAAFKNSGVLSDSIQTSKWTTAGSNYYEVGGSAIVNLSAGDVVDLRGRCTSTASGAVTLWNAVLRIVLIDAIGPQGPQGTNPGPRGYQGWQGPQGNQGAHFELAPK